jgi:hypothetical protein
MYLYCREDFCSVVEDLRILQQRIYSAVKDIQGADDKLGQFLDQDI